MDNQVQQWLAEGIARAKAGQREQARELLLRVVERDEHNAPAWLWLSSLVDNDSDRRVALENVLTLEPENAAAIAGLDWLDRQTSAQAPPVQTEESVDETAAGPPPAQESESHPTPSDEMAFEPEGCPYCGQAVSESATRCPQCKQPLVIHALKHPDFSWRLAMLVVAWLLQVVADLAASMVIVSGFMATGSMLNALGLMYVRTYLTGSAFTSGVPMAEVWRIASVLIVFDAVMAAWSLAIAALLPWRRPAAPTLAPFVAVLHVLVALGGFAAGVVSLWIMLARLALALFTGFLALEVHDEFVWETTRQRLELDRGVKTSMDYYSRGRHYRRLGQLAKAILHWERAVQLSPGQFAFRVALGNACYASGRYDDAANQFRAALRLNPEADDVRQLLGEIDARRSSGDSDL